MLAGVAADALTDEVIAAAMRRAEKAVCPLLDDFCYGLAFSATEVVADLSPQGWGKIGCVVRDSGREAWHAWYNVNTARDGSGNNPRSHDDATRTPRCQLIRPRAAITIWWAWACRPGESERSSQSGTLPLPTGVPLWSGLSRTATPNCQRSCRESSTSKWASSPVTGCRRTAAKETSRPARTSTR